MFTILVLLFSLILWGSLAIFKFRVPNLAESSEVKIFPMILYILNGFIPSILGIALFRLTEKKTWKDDLKTILPKKMHLKIYGEKLIILILVIICQFILYHLFIDTFDFSVIIAQLGQLIPLIILGPLSEEIGWRGYLEKQADGYIKKPYKPIIIGLIRSLWHLPLFYILGTTQQVNRVNFLTFSVLMILLSIIMTYYREKTNRSIFTAIFIHYLYTVGLTFYILGTIYSLQTDVLSIIPFLIFGSYACYQLQNNRTKRLLPS